MSFSCGVFNEKNSSRDQRNLLPSSDLDLSTTTDGNQVLTLPNVMPVFKITGSRPYKPCANGLEHLGLLLELSAGMRYELQVHVFSMRLPVRASIKTCDAEAEGRAPLSRV